MPSPDPKEDAKKWNTLPDKCSSSSTNIKISESSIFPFILNILYKIKKPLPLNILCKIKNLFTLNILYKIKKLLPLNILYKIKNPFKKELYLKTSMEDTFKFILKHSKIVIPPEICQFAILICHHKSNSNVIIKADIKGPFYPHNKHSEDYVIEILERMIKTNEINKYSEISIYTTNNPCIMRKNYKPCMSNLISLSVKLIQDYEIKMNILFSKFYIFSTNMGPIFKNCPESYCKEIIEASDHLAPHLKFSVEFNISEFNYEFKKFVIIPKDKPKVVYENKITFPQFQELKTCKEWKQTVIETAEQLVSEMRPGDSEMTPFYNQLKSQIIAWCDKKINRAKLLNEEFGEVLKQQVVLHFLEDHQDLKHLKIVRIPFDEL